MIHTLENKTPKFISNNYFVAANATIIGDVIIGDKVSIWFNAVIRGDCNSISIGDKTNIQDACVLHPDLNYKVTVGNRVTIGHKAILHGCTVCDDCLIGINAVILNGATIGNNCIIGAGALIPPGKKIPNNSVVMGFPGKIVRETTSKDITLIKTSAKHYVENMELYAKI